MADRRVKRIEIEWEDGTKTVINNPGPYSPIGTFIDAVGRAGCKATTETAAPPAMEGEPT